MQNDKIRKLIKSEFELHPKAQLKDYYKLFFQGTFGPGHIISSRSSARKFLQNELEETSIFEERDYQNIPKKNKPKNNTVIELKSDYPHILTTYLGLFLYLHDFEKYKLVHHKLIEKN